MSAILETPYCQMMRQQDEILLRMSAEEKRAHAQEVWTTCQELITAAASRLGIEGKEIAKRTGRSASWVTKVSNSTASRGDACILYCAAMGFDLSGYLAEAEDLVEIRRKRAAARAHVQLSEEE